MLVTRQRPRKPKHVQLARLRQRKSHARNKKPRCANGKKKPNSGRRHEVQLVNLLGQEPLVPITLEEFFPRDFLKKVAVNMASCSMLEGEDREDDAQEGA